MKCIICGKECKGPEGVVHPVDGFGFRHLHCDPQEHLQKLDPSSPGIPDAMFTEDKDGGVHLTPFGALVTARGAQASASAQKTTKGGE